MRKTIFQMTSALVFLSLLAVSGGTFKGQTERRVSSLEFPRHELTSDVGDILSDYSDYLRFVLEIGRRTNPRSAALLERKYLALRKYDKELSARFLRGLRFEMVQKLEF